MHPYVGGEMTSLVGGKTEATVEPFVDAFSKQLEQNKWLQVCNEMKWFVSQSR